MNYAQYDNKRHDHHKKYSLDGTKALFAKTCVLCGTVIVIAITVKVVMSLFM